MRRRAREDSAMIHRNRGGCVWDVIRFFGLRRIFYFQDLLYDEKHGSGKIATCGKVDPSDQEHLPSHHAEKDQGLHCASEDAMQMSKSIRMLMDEDISKAEKLVHISFTENKQHKNYSKQTGIPSDVISDRPDSSEEVPNSKHCQSQHKVPVERLQEMLALVQKIVEDENGEQILLEESTPSESIIAKRNVDNTEAQTTQNHHILRRKLNEVLEIFLSNKAIGMKETKYVDDSQQSQEFLESLETLYSGMNLPQEIFRGSASHLSEHIQHLWNAQSKEQLSMKPCKLLEYIKPLGNESRSIGLKACEEPLNHKALQKKGTKRNSRKEIDASPSATSDSLQVSSREVLEKLPTSRTESSSTASSSNSLPRSPSSLRAHMKNERAIFHISFHEVKRRVRNLLGHRNKKQNFTSTGPQTKNWYGLHPKDTCRWMARNMIGARFATTRSYNARQGNNAARIKTATKPNGHEAAGVLDFQREAKSHIIEMLDFRDDNIHLPDKKATDTLVELLSLQEDNSTSSYSPGRHKELGSPRRLFGAGSVNQQTSLAECRLARHVEEGLPCAASTSDNREESQGFSDQLRFTTGTGVQGLFTAKTSSSEGFGNLDAIGIDAKSRESDDSIGIHEDDRSYQSSAQDLPKAKLDLQCPRCCTPGDLDIHGTEDPDINIQKTDQPSPASVLDLPLLDDVGSPECTASRKNQQDEPPMSPRQLQSEEHNDSRSTPPPLHLHQEDERSNLSYLRALLEASGLLRREAWESRRHRRHLFDPLLFHEVEPPPSSNPLDPGLFFDRVGEALREIYDRCFATKPWVGLVDPKVRPLPEGEELLLEVWRKARPCGVSMDLRTVDEIVGRYMGAGSWVEIAEGVDEIGVAIGDEVLEEALDETLLVMLGV